MDYAELPYIAQDVKPITVSSMDYYQAHVYELNGTGLTEVPPTDDAIASLGYIPEFNAEEKFIGPNGEQFFVIPVFDARGKHLVENDRWGDPIPVYQYIPVDC